MSIEPRERVDVPEWFRHVDVHTHVAADDEAAIVSLEPDQPFGNHRFYSVGIHPWHADSADFDALEHRLADPRVVAVGECGLDRLKGPDMMTVQMPVFEHQARLAEALGKPLIVHCVRAYAELLALRSRLHPRQPWIVHGYNRGDALARQLTNAGLYLSLPRGRKAPDGIDTHYILRETDRTI